MPNLNQLHSYVPDGLTPRYASIPRWCEISGLGRTVTYRLLGDGVLKAVKVGRRTLIDVRHGLLWMAALPSAQVAPTSVPDCDA
jgi:hypothetical protein